MQVQPDLCVQADPVQLEQVLLNLLINARQAMLGRGGCITIKAPDLDAALEWGRKAARATTLPGEVRPFQGEAED